MKKHVQRLLLVASMLVVPWMSNAQTLGEYTFSTGVDTAKWVDMSSATQILTVTGNDSRASSVVNIGFPFPFGENSYTQYSVNTDGNLRLGPTVTGTGAYATPFSTANASINNPKINFLGCDGYGVSGSHYVKALNTTDADNESMLCVEFCLGTFSSSTRNNLYRWQVHMYPSGNIEVVYGSAPAAPPAVSHQPGLCVNASDGWYVDASHSAYHFTSGISLGIASGNWPEEGRYYRFAVPVVTCPKPTGIVVAGLDYSSFNISWTDTSDATSWIVRLIANDSIVYNNVVTSYPVSFTGLNPATNYRVEVAGLCQNGDTSHYCNTTVLTPCAELTSLPYIQTFDDVEGSTSTSVPTNNLPPCWYYRNTGTTVLYSGYPIVYTSMSNAHSGSNAMRFYTYSTVGTYGDQYAIMPITDSVVLPLSDLQLSFWMRSTSTSYSSYVVVGVMTNPNDVTSFIPIDTVYTNASTYYAHHSVYLAGYQGPHGYIAFKAPQFASGYNALLIDDVVLDHMPSCVPVRNIRTTHIGPNSVDLEWNQLGRVNSWTVTYMPTGSSIDTASTFTVYDTLLSLTGLTANTDYTVMIATNCDSSVMGPVTATFHTICDYIASIPYTEDFEGVAGSTSTTVSANNLPSCWMYNNIGTATSYSGYPMVYNDSTNAHSGTNSVRFYTTSTAVTYADQIAILPATDSVQLPLSALQVSFWMRSTSSSYNSYVTVGVMTNPADASTFVPVETIYTYSSTTYAEYSVLMGRYRGPHGHIAIMAPQPSTSSNALLIDDVTIDYRPSCPVVGDITVTSATSDSIGISWFAIGDETAWIVSDGTNEYVVYDSSYMFGGLNPNTEYTLSVRALCSATSDTSDAATVTVTTACSYLTVLPYIENFDSHTAFTSTSSSENNLPSCWEYINHGTRATYSGYPIIYGSSSDAHSGSNSMRFYSYYNAADSSQYAILPCTDPGLFPVGDLTLSFYMRANSSTSTYKAEAVVGVITDPTDLRTFVPIDTVNTNGMTTYSRHEVSFSTYRGLHGCVALMFPSPVGSAFNYNSGYVDDMVLGVVTGCQPVINLAAGNITDSSADITWADTNNNVSWTVEYGVGGFARGTGTIDTVYGTMTTLTGLMSNTLYDVYVTPNCGSGMAGSALVSFRTDNIPVALPFSCNFEDAAQNAIWMLENGANTNKWHIGTAANNGGTHSLYVSDNNGVSNSYTVSSSTLDYAYVDVMIPSPGDYNYSYDWRCHGEGNYDFLRVVLIPRSQPLTGGTALPSGLSTTSTPAGWIALDGGSRLNLQADWQTRGDVVTVPAAGAYHLAFVFRCDGSGGTTPPPAVDNIMLAAASCLRPDSVMISSLTQTSADFVWSGAGTSTEWQYQLDSGVINTVYTASVSLTGLTVNTSYTFRLRSVCGVGDTSFWYVYDFRTPCDYITIPYAQDFEAEEISSSTTGSAFVNCWTRLNNGSSYGGYPYVGGDTYNHTVGGSKGMYWYNSTTFGTYGDYICAVLPPVDTAVAISSLQLSFWAKSSSATVSPMFQVGVMTDPNNLATFVGVDTFSVSGTNWREIQIPLSTYSGSGRYVALKADRSIRSWGLYTDDVTLDYTPTCVVPRNVFATDATTSTITVDWVDITPAMEWQVEYGPQGFVRGSSAGNQITAYSHPVTIYGLDTLSSYDIYIRPVCTVGDTAGWMGYPVATLNTTMCDNAADFTIGSPTSSGTTYYAPVNNLYRYTLSEVIIESAEIGGPMDIEYIAYYYDYATAMTDKTNCTIYFQPTTKSAFVSSSDVVALDTATAVKVYTGHLNCSQGWNYFTLDTVYHYDGSTNLMIIVDDNSNDYNSSSYIFRTEPCTGNKVLYYYSDSQNPDPATIASSFSGTKAVNTWRPVMQLLSCSAPYCPQPIVTGATHTYESATISWTGDGTEYEVNIKEANAPIWPVSDIHVSGNSYTFNGLNFATNYIFRVRQDCTSDSLDHSQWVVDTVLTDSLPCFAPTGLTVSDVTNEQAAFDWEPLGYESMWTLHVWFSGNLDTVYTVSAHPVTVGGFTSGVTYSVSVRPLCGSAHNIIGDWGDTITFTTATCPDVTGLTASEPMASSVTLTWAANPVVLSWEVEYGYAGFQVGTGTVDTTSTPGYTANGLLDETTYEFHVRAVCGTDWYSENWASVNATTLAETEPCDTVSSLIADNVTKLTAHIIWTPGSTGEAWQVVLSDADGATVVEDRVTATDYLFTGLTPGTEYVARVRTDCGEGVYSDYMGVGFTTLPQEGIEDICTARCVIYPNPTNSSTTISVTGVSGKVKVAVVDMNGREVASEKIECTTDCEKSMNVDGLAQGAYFVRITGENVNMVRKLIVR